MEFDVKSLFFNLMRKWYLLFVGFLIGAVLGYAYFSTSAVTTYTTTAKLEVVAVGNVSSGGNNNVSADLSRLNYEHSLIPTILDIINTNKNLENVADRITQVYAEENTIREAEGKTPYAVPQNVTRASVAGAVSASGGNDEKTLLITVKATAKSPEASIAYINAYIDCAIDVIEPLHHDIELKISDDQRPSFATMKTDVTVNEVSASRYVLLGSLAGFALVLAVLVIIFACDNRIKSEKDIQAHFGLPVLAILPDVKGRRSK